MDFTLSRYSKRFLSLLATRNSEKVMGAICMKLTLPTGKEEGFDKEMPNREAVHAI